MNKRLWWMWASLLCLAVAGCGDDDGGGNTGDEDAGPTAGMGSGGMGGGGGGTGGGGGSGGGAATSVPCGSNTCTNPLAGMMLPIQLPEVCCADEEMGTCGTMQGGACMAPPPSDPRCPTVMSPLPGINLISCCNDMGLCGLDASMLGMGCVDFETISSGPFGAILPVPDATVCEGDAGMVDEQDGGN